MIIASASQFHVYLQWGQRPFSIVSCLNSVLDVKAVVAAFNQEKALVGAFSMIIHHRRLIVYSTNLHARIVQNCAELHELAIVLAISGDLGTRLALPRVEEDDGSQLGQSPHSLPPSASSKLSGHKFAIKAQCTYLISRRLFPMASKRKDIWKCLDSKSDLS